MYHICFWGNNFPLWIYIFVECVVGNAPIDHFNRTNFNTAVAPQIFKSCGFNIKANNTRHNRPLTVIKNIFLICCCACIIMNA